MKRTCAVTVSVMIIRPGIMKLYLRSFIYSLYREILKHERWGHYPLTRISASLLFACRACCSNSIVISLILDLIEVNQRSTPWCWNKCSAGQCGLLHARSFLCLGLCEHQDTWKVSFHLNYWILPKIFTGFLKISCRSRTWIIMSEKLKN